MGEFSPAVELQGEGLVDCREGAHSLRGGKWNSSFITFLPGEELLHHGTQTNSCSVDPVDIKEEKPFLNSGVECEVQARTDCNQASDIIGKADWKNLWGASPYQARIWDISTGPLETVMVALVEVERGGDKGLMQQGQQKHVSSNWKKYQKQKW